MFRLLTIHERSNCYKQKFKNRVFPVVNSYCWHERHKSFYHALGLDSTASAKDIKSAYYKLSLQFHPDKNKGSEESVAKFREITEAYEVLSNPEKKKKYDQDYNLQPYYSETYRQAGSYRRQTNYQGQYTGRTKGFDYDEHFKKHYEDYNKRQAEYEYFKRRWEYDYNRKYPNTKEYYRNRPEMEDEWTVLKKMKRQRYTFYTLICTWGIFFMITSYDDIFGPEKTAKPRPLYYKVTHKNGNTNDAE